ncbi:MAG TPA: hypothetical protein VF911_15875, partial [Thermoanaerobaculia bacterium]
ERTPSFSPDAPRFPTPAATFAQAKSAKLRVQADDVDQNLFVPSDNGAFYLVEEGPANVYIIPAHEPMTTQVYKLYYKSSYDCSPLGTGDLYVVEPATVSIGGNGWRLATRGKLEIRAS